MQTHVLRGETTAELGHQQTPRREAGQGCAHHPIPRAFAQELQPRRDRDRLRDAEAFDAARARALRHLLPAQEEETSREGRCPGWLLQAQRFLLVGVGVQQRVQLLGQRRVGLRLALPALPDLLRTNKLNFIPASAVHSSFGKPLEPPHPNPVIFFPEFLSFFSPSWSERRGRFQSNRD